MRVFLLYLSKKGLRTRAVSKEINNGEIPGNVNELVAQNWFRHLKECDTSLKDKPRSGRSSVIENEHLLEMLEHQIGQGTRTLSTELDLYTISRHFHKLNFMNRRCREVPPELINDQATLAKQLLVSCPILTSNFHWGGKTCLFS